MQLETQAHSHHSSSKLLPLPPKCLADSLRRSLSAMLLTDGMLPNKQKLRIVLDRRHVTRTRLTKTVFHRKNRHPILMNTITNRSQTILLPPAVHSRFQSMQPATLMPMQTRGLSRNAPTADASSTRKHLKNT